MYSHIFKGLLTKQEDEKIHNCVCDSKYNIADIVKILWSFMLAVLLDIFYRITQKDTGKLKSFL